MRYRLTPDERDQVHEIQIGLRAIKPCMASVAHAAGIWQPVAAFEDYGDAVCMPCQAQALHERGQRYAAQSRRAQAERAHAQGAALYAHVAQRLARGQRWNHEIPTRERTPR